MTQTVIDSSNLEAILNDAGVEKPQQEPTTEPAPAEVKPEAKADQKPDDEALDVEGEDGLTPRQKQELSAKMQKAIGRKHRQLKEAEEFAATQYAERKLAEQRAQNLERQLEQLKPKAVVTEPQKPKREDFASESDYIDAQIQFGISEGLRKEEARQAQIREDQAREAVETAARERIKKAIELVPDFAEVTEGADLEVPPAIASYMQSSELFAELGYHFAKNPDLLLSLTNLSPAQQLVKIGRIEATLKPFGSETVQDGDKKPSAKPDVQTAQPSDNGKPPSEPRRAPVINPLTTSGSAVEKEPNEMNIRETIQAFAKSRKVDFGRRKRH